MVIPEMLLVVCGGMQHPQDTQAIVRLIRADPGLNQLPLRVFTPESWAAVLSGSSLRGWLTSGPAPPRLMIWAFSAGCMGAAALANYWQCHGGEVLALFMVDGWGVPWSQVAPLHRLSHDAFTHTTSNYLGEGVINFVANPAVDHRHLWQSPQLVTGQQILTRQSYLFQRWLPGLQGLPPSSDATAANFLCTWSNYHLSRAVSESC
ncbi:MAG: hypothetical protein KGQ93_03515 [Cyanobacteria bacterium REEB459]|nr:hypothetical protein [Cyanobacteria bacterium REEB459]